MINLAEIIFFVIGWLFLYGLCSLIIKFFANAVNLKLCVLTGFCVGLIFLFIGGAIYFINSHNSEQYEGTMWMLFLFGFPASWFHSLFPQSLVRIPLFESLILSFLLLANYCMIGLSVGWFKLLIRRKTHASSKHP